MSAPEFKDLELGIGSLPPGHEDAANKRPVECKLCAAELVPNARGDVFTAFDCWWVCDACTARLRPDLLELVDRLRRLDGPYEVRQVSSSEARDLGRSFFICPTCARWQQPYGWCIVERASGRPICKTCQLDRVPADVRDLWKALRVEARG